MSAPEANPYVFAIADGDVNPVGQHAIIAQRLTKAGFDIGLMLWTATPDSYTKHEIAEFWSEAMHRAGIERIEVGHDNDKGRTWYKVWKKNP